MSTSRANRPGKEKASKKEQHKEKDLPKHNATAEQIRMATMITDKNKETDDPELLAKIAQVKELTGRSETECCYALHDSDYDLERAIEILLENEGQETEWKEAGKKKKEQPPPKIETPPPEMDKPDRPERYDKMDSHDRSNSAPRGRRDRGPPRFQRGRGRENNFNDGDRSDNRERSNDNRGRGGRGRGSSRSRGRGRGGGGGGVSRDGFRSNRDAPRGGGFDAGPQIDTWTNETAANAEKENTIGSWGDEWTADEWTGSLEESKVFTPSQPTTDNKSNNFINDNDAAMFSVSSIEKQAFTSTSLQDSTAPTLTDATNTYSPLQSMSPPKPIGQNSIGQRLDLGMLLAKSPEAPVNTTTQQENNFLAQFAKQAEDSIKSAVGINPQMNTTSDAFMHSYKPQTDYAKQTEESIKNAVGIGATSDMMSDYSKRAEQSIKSALGVSTSQSQPPVAASQAPRPMVNQHGAPPPGPPGVCVQQQQQSQSQLNQQKKRKLPPPSKIPASAVEMPAGMNFNLDVQFGSGWESGDSGFSFGGSEPPHSNYNTTSQQPTSQQLNNHLTNTSKPMGTPAVSESSPASVMTSASSAATAAAQKQISSLDGISGGAPQQAPSQSPRPTPGAFHNTNTTPPEFSQSNKQISSPPTAPEPIPFPSAQTDRKTSPYNAGQQQRTTSTQGANKSSTSPQMNAYNSSSNYPNNYSSSAYKSSAAPSNYPVSSLASNSLQGQRDYGTSNSYSTSSSFQNATGSSGYGNSNPQSSLYPNVTSSFQGGQSSSYNSSSNSQYTPQVSSTGGGGSSYQQSSYHSRDNTNYSSQSSSNTQSGAGSATTGYQSTTNSYQNPVTSSSPATQSAYQTDSQSASTTGYSSQYGTSGTPNGTTQTNTGSTYNSSNQQQQYNNISAAASSSTQQSGVTISSNKLSDSLSKMTVKAEEQSGSNYGSVSGSDSIVSTVSSLSTSSVAAQASTASSAVSSNNLGLSSTVSVSTVANTLPSATSTKSSGIPLSNKTAPNLPPGVPVMGHSYMMGQPGHGMPFPAFGLPQQPMYSYEEMQAQLLQQRIALPSYYDMQLQPPTTLTGLDQTKLNTVPYSASTDGKLNRVDAQSPVNATGQTVQTSTQQNQSAGTGHSGQTFINTALPPGYANYYYPSGILPGGYSYTPTVLPVGSVQVPAATNAAPQHGTSAAQFQKPGTAPAYGGYSTTFDALASQTHDFSKTFVSQNQNTKGTVSASSVTSTGSDISGAGAGYGKTQFHSQVKQTVDKSGFHGNTPPLNLTGLPGAGNQGGAMGGGAPYGQYMPVMTHQPHSQMLHPHLQHDSSVNSSRGGGQQTGSQGVKATGPKGFSAAAYWGGN